MTIRKYAASDCLEAMELFYNTVHSINAKDYAKDQLNAWAPKDLNASSINASFLKNHTIVAVENNIIVGFGSIGENGYLDCLFTHKDHQRKGIAAELCNILEKIGKWDKITVHASITAKPFFEKRGYRTIKKQTVQRRGVLLENFVMEKNLKLYNNA